MFKIIYFDQFFERTENSFAPLSNFMKLCAHWCPECRPGISRMIIINLCVRRCRMITGLAILCAT